MKDWAWISAVVGTLGIIGTLTGVVLGKRFEQRTTHLAWLREKRLEAYTSFLARERDLADCWLPMIRATTDADFRLASEERHRVLSRMSRDHAALLLVGAPQVNRASNNLLKAVRKLGQALEEQHRMGVPPTAPFEDWPPMAEAKGALMQFLGHAKLDLGAEAGRRIEPVDNL